MTTFKIVRRGKRVAPVFVTLDDGGTMRLGQGAHVRDLSDDEAARVAALPGTLVVPVPGRPAASASSVALPPPPEAEAPDTGSAADAESPRRKRGR